MGKREERVYIVDLVAWLICARSRIGFGLWSWQNLVGFGGLDRILQKAVECGRIRRIAVENGRLP